MELYFDYLKRTTKDHYFEWSDERVDRELYAKYESKGAPLRALQSMKMSATMVGRAFQSNRVYVLGKDFEDMFVKMCDLDVKSKYLEDTDWCYIHFNRLYQLSEEVFFDFIFYTIATNDDVKTLTIATAVKDKKGKCLQNIVMSNLRFSPEQTIEQDLMPFDEKNVLEGRLAEKSIDPKDMDLTKHAAMFAKFILYINSGEPDMRFIKPPNKGKYKQQYTPKNDVTIAGHHRVGYGWKKERIYSKDSTFVPPYVARRWTGKRGEQKIKFVLVREHTKHYKNVNKPEQLRNLV